jgi:hypothetical protein
MRIPSLSVNIESRAILLDIVPGYILCRKLLLILTEEEVQEDSQKGDGGRDRGGGEWAWGCVQGTSRLAACNGGKTLGELAS